VTESRRAREGYRLLNVLQYLDLYQRLPVEPLLVPNDLDCNLLACLVIQGLHNLAKGPFPKLFKKLVAIRQVIVADKSQIAARIIVS